MAQGVTCARCGAATEAGARFCASCGAPLEDHPREERRVVTVLFGDLSGFTELTERRDAEEVKGVVDRAFEELARIVVGFGGRVDKIIGDEIMAVFGAPQAHEDDAERAVRAALQIQRALADLSAETERDRGFPLQMHIGVNTGEVVAGYVGGSDSYTVLGDAVNTARRINQAAEPGQILAGESTFDAARNAIEFSRVGAVTAKGKRLPVNVYEAVAERGLPGERALRAAPLIGREDELQVLSGLAAITRRDRRPMVATIVGEAGMGKTRLAAEFARRVWSLGVRVVAGRALPYGTASPAFALEQMLRAALAVDPAAGPDDVRAHVKEKLDGLGLAAENERVLALLGLGAAALAKRAPAPGTQASQSANLVLDTALAVLERIAEREGALVLSLHEAHWAEDEVLDAIARTLGNSRAPLFVLCLARPELVERRPSWGSGSGSLVLPLGPLPRARAAELLDSLAPELPPSLRDGVLDRAGGNPFYLEELARLLVDRKGDPVGQFAVPGSVQALVTARLDALPPDEKLLLQDAAVVGEQFWPGALSTLEATPANDAALASLVAQGFIDPSDDDAIPGERGYRFRQTLVREVAYSSVPKHVRARQHAAVAEWLERADPEDVSDLIGHHYERAAVLAREIGDAQTGAAEKAHAFLLRAGDKALGMDATSTAASFFERALALDPASCATTRRANTSSARSKKRRRPATLRPKRRRCACSPIRCACAATPRRRANPSRAHSTSRSRRTTSARKRKVCARTACSTW
jgi:class 3 adenylate cyclase